MGSAHPALDRTEGVLDRAAAQRHWIGRSRQALAHLVNQIFVLPSCDPSFLTAGAAVLKRAVLARVDPVSPDFEASFFPCVAIDQLIPGRAKIDIAISLILKVCFDKHALLTVA